MPDIDDMGNDVDNLLDDDMLIDDDEVDGNPDAPPERSPSSQPRKKGRKKKKQQTTTAAESGLSANKKRKRAHFLESQLRQELAKTDLSEMMARWDFESGMYTVVVNRVQPVTYRGRNTQGFLQSFQEVLTEDVLADMFGGGVYHIVVRGPNPTTGSGSVYLDAARVRISGPPKFGGEPSRQNDDDDGMTDLMIPPQMMPSRRKGGKRTAAQMFGMNPYGGGGGGSANDDAMVKMSFDTLREQAREAADEARALREEVIAAKSGDNGQSQSLHSEALRLLQRSADKNAEAQKEAMDKILELRSSPGGIPAEMLQTMTENHRAEMRAMEESHKTQLSQERDRHDQELRQVRDFHDKDKESLRERLEAEVRKAREDRDKAVEAERERSKAEREALIRQHELQVENLKSTHMLTVEQLKGQQEMTKTLFETTSEARVRTLESELERTRNDLKNASEKVATQGDLATQATSLKTVFDNLGSVFGAQPSGAIVSGSIESAEEEPKGFLDKAVKLADSRLGEILLGAFAQQMQPQVPPYLPSPYGGQPMYGGQPPYGGAPPYGGQPMYGQPQPEEYEDVEGTEIPLEDDSENVVEAQQPAAAAGQVAAPQPPATQPPVQETVEDALAGLPPEVQTKLRDAVKRLSDAMTAKVPPEQVADQIISEVQDPMEIGMFVNADPAGIAADAAKIQPGTPLNSFAGKKFLTAVSAAVRAKVPAAAQPSS